MPLPGLAVLSPDADLNAVKNYIIRLERKLSFLLENGLDTDNIFEAGGWRVGENRLASKDGDVGMSSADDAPDPVRLWAGSTNKEAAPWRVYKSGKSVMTGALIQSKDSGYPRIVMDPSNDLFGAYMSASKYIKLFAFEGSVSGAPALQFRDEGVPTYALMYIDNINYDFNILSPGNIYIGAGLSDLFLSGNRVRFDNWASIYNNATGRTLQQDLDAKASTAALAGKATSGVSTGLSGGHNHGIADGTVLRTADGGTATFFAAPQHSHAQV